MSLEELIADAVRRVVREELRQAFAGATRPAEDRRVTAAEGASAAGLASPATIRAWADAGRINRYGEGRAVRYSLAEILAVRPSPKTLGGSIAERAEQIRRRHG